MKAPKWLEIVKFTLSILCPIISIAFIVYQFAEHQKEKKLMEQYYRIAGESCAKMAYVLEKKQPKIPSENEESKK